MRLLAASTFMLALASSVLASPIVTANASSINVANSSHVEARTLSPNVCSNSPRFLRLAWDLNMDRAMEGNVDGLCHRLWTEIDDFIGCVVSMPNWCRKAPADPDRLIMRFHTSQFCRPWMIERAFWRATGNRWGEVHCKEGLGP